MEIPKREPILNFNEYCQLQSLQTYTFKNSSYIPIAESILSNENIYLDNDHRIILEFIADRKLSIDKWILLKEGSYYDDAVNFFNSYIVEPTVNLVKGAINWAIQLGSDLMSAISTVVNKIMEGIQFAWDSVKIEANKWFSGNRSLKRQMTISINQQISTIKESLNEDDLDQNRIIWDTLTKETGQLSNMFVESIGKIIQGDIFASKVTMSINKAVNESKEDNVIKENLKNNLLSFLPKAISENILDINKHSHFNSNNIHISSFRDMKRLDESIKLIDDFYKWCIEKLNNLPPFNWIKQFTDNLKTNANESLKNTSQFLSDTFGISGPFDFQFLGPTFAILINAITMIGQYVLIDLVLAAIASFIIPGSGAIVMFLLNLYGLWILGEVLYDLINDTSDEDVATQN